MVNKKKPIKWRKWNNLLHRDVGYLCVGLTLVYAISGVAVNHRADWNPNYRITRDVVQLDNIPEQEPGSSEFVQSVLFQLSLSGPVRGTFRRTPESVDIFLEETTISVDLVSGEASFEEVKERPILRETNYLHLNEPKKMWTLLADVYAVALAFLAISGMFVLKGKKGIKGRGAWLTAIGVLVPILFRLFYF